MKAMPSGRANKLESTASNAVESIGGSAHILHLLFDTGRLVKGVCMFGWFVIGGCWYTRQHCYSVSF
jgi:hypothetical protein